MIVVSGINSSVLKKLRSSVVTLGVFDGVHLAHRKIIKKTIQRARELGSKSVLLTFEKHPKRTTHKKAPPILTTTTKKIALLRELGPDVLVLINFNKKFASLSAQSFIEKVLVKKFKAKEIIIGHDYGFGKGKEGNGALLKKEGEAFGFKTRVVSPLKINGKRISSTVIREVIRKGDILSARKYLGHDYSVIGRVEGGKKIGRTFGFPTANLNCFNEVVPKEGVYAVRIKMDGRWYNGACSITSPTFDRPGKPTLNPEVFIFDFKKSIYHKVMELFFVKRIRDSRKFPDVPALVAQIKRDIAKIKKILQKNIVGRNSI